MNDASAVGTWDRYLTADAPDSDGPNHYRLYAEVAAERAGITVDEWVARLKAEYLERERGLVSAAKSEEIFALVKGAR